MKIGNVEGTPEEVRDFFENNGLNPSDFFEKPESQLNKIWLIVPSVASLICILLLVSFGPAFDKLKIMVFLLGLSTIVWLSVSVHIRFRSGWGSGVIILCGLLILLVALGVMEPAQLTDYLGSVGET